jgi:hypothetical protein
MSIHIPMRTFNRSQRVRIGGSSLSPTVSTWINVDSPRNQRDLARHSGIGAIYDVGDALGFPSDGYITNGGFVTVRASTLVMDISPVYFVRASAVAGSQVADTVTIGAADATNPRIDVVAVDTATPDIVVVAGTATANATLFNRLGVVPTLPANRIPIALVLVPNAATTLSQANVIQLR